MTALSLQPRRRLVSIHSPHLPVVKVAKQFLIIASAHVAGPNHLRAVDVRPVVKPLPIHIMVRTVAYEHQMTPRSGFQLPHDRHAIKIAARPCRFDLSVGRGRANSQ